MTSPMPAGPESFPLIEALQSALEIAQRDGHELTVELLRMALLNEAVRSDSG